MKTTLNLTSAFSADFEDKVRRTHEGQASWAGEGPFGATCGDCRFLGYFKQIRNDVGVIVQTEKTYGCAEFHRLTGKHGPTVPYSAEACRFFQRRPDGEK